jgi:hypothetical protein
MTNPITHPDARSRQSRSAALAWLGLLLLAAVSCATPTGPTGVAPATGGAPEAGWLERNAGGVAFRYADPDTALVTSITPVVESELARVTGFLGVSPEQSFQLVVWPDRPRFTDRFRALFRETPQCWVIAFGLSSGVEMLPPRLWDCGHPASSSEFLRLLLAHELTHVVHARQPGFGYGSDMSWFLEGLAVYVSGQHNAQYSGVAQARFAQGFVPASLPALMNDGAGYALAGDVVRFIDAAWGRATLRSLTGASSTTAILATLNETEANLLARWRAAAASTTARE